MEIRIRNIIQAMIAVLVLALFAWLYGDAVIKTFKATTIAPSFTEGHSIMAAATAGLIGGIVATQLGVHSSERMKQLGKYALPSSPEQWQAIIGWIYVGVYGALGMVGIIAWIMKSGTSSDPNLVPELVKNLASAVTALFLGVVSGIFSTK
ncbi:MAG: hypothetical protein A2Z14_05120 [Chloroflexi bacterium RBG_16_48_8]|nr:MAG: hypothetical protein A2Z14_05120 [Chloroflexi bacterium RBG_16_48_8]